MIAILAFDSGAGWLPSYTEQWATTYLQVLFESFLFALGVPTAIYSLIVDEDIKRVAQTRVKARRYFLVTALLYVAVFIIVWILHPEPSAALQDPNAARSVIKPIFAAFTVTFLPFAVLVTGLWLNSEFKREKVVARLGADLLKSLDAKSSIDTVALRDLSFLGEHGRAGEEKEIVLNVIDRLTDEVQKRVKDHLLTYNGYELDSLIRHIPAMLNNSERPGNDQDYLKAVEVLANIWRWLGIRNKVTSDAVSTREALKLLALRSVETMSEDTSLAYLEIAAECDSHIIFDIGQAAIRAGKYRLASAALVKLEAMASSIGADEDVNRETKANLLGIAAHLATDGPSGARRAEISLRLNTELFKPSLRHALADAFDYQYSAGRFDIADKINLLLAEATQMKSVDLDASVPV